MPTTLKVYANEDDAMLFWRISAPIPACRGFAIERRITRRGQPHPTSDALLNRTGFENEKMPDPKTAGQAPPVKSSKLWPFQRFSWTDHDASTGDTVSYRIVPMARNAATGNLDPVAAEASSWSPDRVLGVGAGSRFQPFFNRGFVMSQFMSRFLAENKLTLKQFKATRINNATDTTIRTFLSGDLRLALLDQLHIAREEKTDVFAALFEVSDDELVEALAALGKKAHVVLANGSIKAAKGEPAAAARKRDENKKARAKLLKAYAVNIEGAYQHYRFRAFLDQTNRPFNGLKDNDTWQAPKLAAALPELKFFGL